MNTELMMMPHPWKVFHAGSWILEFHAATLICVEKCDNDEEKKDILTPDGDNPITDYFCRSHPVDQLGNVYTNTIVDSFFETADSYFDVFEGQTITPFSNEFVQIVRSFDRGGFVKEQGMGTTLEYIVGSLTDLGIKVVSVPSLNEEIQCRVTLPTPNNSKIQIVGLHKIIQIYSEAVASTEEELKVEKTFVIFQVLDTLNIYKRYVSGSFKIKLTVTAEQKKTRGHVKTDQTQIWVDKDITKQFERMKVNGLEYPVRYMINAALRVFIESNTLNINSYGKK